MSAIELAGPSGVGKSALAAKLGFAPNPRVGLEQALRGIQETARHDGQVAAFCDLIDAAILTARGQRVAERRSFVYRSLWRLLQAKKSRVPALLDGGLVRRAHGVDALKSDIAIEDYYRLMPVADFTVFLVADLDIIKERNIQRGGDHDRSAEAWRAMELDVIARRVFRERGARFVVLDAALSPEENSRRLPCMIPESF